MATHLLFGLILLLTPTFFGFGLLSKVLGSLQPFNPALEGFIVGCEDRPQPCWYGIVPGVTTIDEANRVLPLYDYYLVVTTPDFYESIVANHTSHRRGPKCNVVLRYDSSPVVNAAQLQCRGVSLGELGAVLGPPLGVESNPGYAVRVIFKQEISVLESGFLGWESFHDPIQIIDLPPRPVDNQYTPSFGWHGLIPAWRYCQIQYIYRDCSRGS